MRRFLIETLGCPKNEYDSSILAYLLKREGAELVDDVSNATDVVVNTCAFINEAKMESLEIIFELLELKKERKNLRVYIYGCLAQRYFDNLLEQIPEIDGIIGLCDLHRVSKWLVNSDNKIVLRCEQPVVVQRNFCGRFLEAGPFVYVKIGDGCDRNCAFCSIPLFKGRHVSRDRDDIVEEIAKLIESGKKEIILVDQDITQFRDNEGNGLIELLQSIDKIEGNFWVRTMYLHPDHVNIEMIREMAKLKKWIHYLDIPIQHGSNDILRRMGRIKSREELLSFFKTVRNEIPDVILRSSFIIGFPGETEKDFEETLEMIEKVGFERFGFFTYSDEEGTFAYEYKNKIDLNTMKRRLKIANDFASNFLGEVQLKNIGKKFEVLVEGFDKESNRFFGRSYMDAPDVDTYVYISNDTKYKVHTGSWITVQITGLEGLDLEGSIILYGKNDSKVSNNTGN